MKVSLIATVLNADAHIGDFLASIAAQERAPDEIIVVDGGSTDGTIGRLRAAGDAITLLEEPGANIARGRNLAIAAASHDAIAVADADCAYAPGWLDALVAPLEARRRRRDGLDGTRDRLPARRVRRLARFPARGHGGGRGVVHAERAQRCVPARGDRRGRRLPRVARDRRGHVGEPPVARARVRDVDGARSGGVVASARFAPRDLDAVRALRARRRQGGDVPRAPRVAVRGYGGLAAVLVSRRTWPKLLALGGAVAYARTPVTRARARLTGPRDRAMATVVIPALLAYTDVAKIWGYALGLADRLTGRVRPQ